MKTGKTTPPKPYTEASLISDMRGVAKYVSDESLKEILKETSGIGTAATQAAIIETLKKREAIKVEKKKLVSTPFGRMVISKMPKAMTDPGVTATWEYTLGLIAKGKYNPTHFMNGIDSFIKGQLAEFNK